MQKLFSECLVLDKILHSWLEAWIVVLPKLDKELEFPQDYRSISLLNFDYKILMTIMANRLNRVLDSYIHMDQSGFIKGCYMKDKIRQLLNMIDGVRENGEPVLFYFLDAEKAFDRVEWLF